MNRKQLDRMYELRWDDPQEANRLLERGIRDSPLDLLGEVLLLYGATFRQLNQLNNARWAYFVAESEAQFTGNRQLLATIAQWRSKVEFASGEFGEALGLLRFAAGTFCELGDSNGEARVLVDMASNYLDRGMVAEGLACSASALSKLEADDHWYRFSAFQVTACCAEKLGNSERAVTAVESARELLNHVPTGAAVRFTWLEAKIKAAFQPTQVENVLRRAANFFLETGELLDASLATLELALILIKHGKRHGLGEVTANLRRITFKAERHPLVEATVRQIYHELVEEKKISIRLLAASIESLRAAVGEHATGLATRSTD